MDERGKPKRPGDTRRNHAAMLLMTAGDAEELRAQADEVGISTSELIHRVVFQAMASGKLGRDDVCPECGAELKQ